MKNKHVHILLITLFMFTVTSFQNISAQGNSQTVAVQMGAFNFSWTFDKSVEYGYFVDGQPWIVMPDDGVNLVSVSPARKNNADVYDVTRSTAGNAIAVKADINQTVVNPPVGVFYNNNQGPFVFKKAFGWDSRGAIRYGLGNNYDPLLGWDGVSPKSLTAGDIITTAKSIETLETGLDTDLEAVAVLTVLAAAPPADAFRPGVVRSAARKTSPVFFTKSQIIDLTAHLISAPSQSLFGETLTGTIPDELAAQRLTNLFPGPSVLVGSFNDGQAFNARYNNSNTAYGAAVAQALGDLGIGALAKWLTPAQRELCQIRFLQRAIDTYESLLAGLILTHNGGHYPGYGALLTVAGKMLNSSEMLSVNDAVNGRDPLYFLGDYSQFMYIDNPNITEPNTPAVGSVRRTSVETCPFNLHNLTLPITEAGANYVVVSPDFVWNQYRAAHEVINLKLRVEAGNGAGAQYYVVTGISDYKDAANNNPGTVSTPSIKGGKLTIKPQWANGTPDAAGVIKSYAVVAAETPCWVFKSGGVEHHTGASAVTGVSLSPDTDYGSINLGSYISYLCAMYALDAQVHYKSGADKWMLNILEIPGYGPYTFAGSWSREMTNPGNVLMRKFLSGIWKEQVMSKSQTGFSQDRSFTSLPIPASADNTSTERVDYTGVSIFMTGDKVLKVNSQSAINQVEVYNLQGIKIFQEKNINALTFEKALPIVHTAHPLIVSVRTDAGDVIEKISTVVTFGK